MDVAETDAVGWYSDGDVEIQMSVLTDAKGKGFQEDVSYVGKIYRDNAKMTDKTALAAWLAAAAKYAGYYTVSLVAPDAMLGEPCGSGYMTLTLAAKGKVKVAGKLADGTAYSGSATAALSGDAVSPSIRVPLYAFKGTSVFGGWLSIRKNDAGDLVVEAGERVLMQMSAPRIVKTIADIAPIYRALGINGYIPSLPVQVAYTGLEDIMIPIQDVEALNALHPDMEAVAVLTEKHKAVSFHCFALPTQAIGQSGNQTITAHVRDFAPLYGIPEESATGTANAALTHYLSTLGVIPAMGDFSYMQGEAMGRPSSVATRISADGTIYVGGTAAIVAKGEINC